MNLYLASDNGRFKGIAKEYAKERAKCTSISQETSQKTGSGVEGEIFRGTNVLQSFYYCDDFTVNTILPNCKRFMLDSGAFTFFGSGKNADWNEYVKKYAKFINDNNIKLFFELDIDKLIGYERVLYYRKQLEDMTGKPCIPVWHKSRGQEEFYKMCERYNYVSIGGIVTREISKKEYKYFPHFIKAAHQHGAKIHGLGFTNMEGLTKYHFDSVDSTAWLSGNRFGKIDLFDGKKIVSRAKSSGQRLSDSKAAALHNYREWVKFQKYADKYL